MSAKVKKTRKKTASNSKGRGVKIDESIKAKAQVMLGMGNTVSFVCDELSLKESTVRTWQKALQNDKKFAEFRTNILNKRHNEYLLKALEAEGTALDIMVKKLETAKICEEKRGELVDRVLKSQEGSGLSAEELKKMVAILLPEALGDITRTFAVLTEKVALMSGKPTANLEVKYKKFEDM